MSITNYNTTKYVICVALGTAVFSLSPQRVAHGAGGDALGAETTATHSAVDTSAGENRTSSQSWLTEPKLKAFGFTWLPRITYTGESGVGIGGHILRPFRWGQDAGAPNSEFRVSGRATSKRQWAAELRLRLGWADRAWSLNTKFGASNIARRFYGIGPLTPAGNVEIYRPQGTLVYIELLRRVLPGMRIGVRAEFEHFELTETVPRGMLESGEVPGAEGGHVMGAGFLWDYDSRDRKYSPLSGSFHQAFAMRFDESTGSKFDFDVYNVDLRKYLAITRHNVVALQVFAYVTQGAPPFWRQAAMGGRAHSRGYRRGRYLDHAMVAYQVEYRFDIWRRFGGAVFAGLADVGRRVQDINHAHMKPTVGFGSRIRLGGTDGVKARIELAFGREEVRFYMSLDEAY
ncbi:MAG: BamA/TamA family outer membrane protein [Candidatus Krumholzibacteria bacterium]|nr:BamA/TamA family outer membrane protein [Candidatus Krumholzibacteria bacterium]